MVGALRVTSSGVVGGEAGTGASGEGWLLARCWVLRKRAGLVVPSGVLCAVRMGLAGGGARSSLSSGLLLCSRWRACRVLLVAPLVGVAGGTGRACAGVVGGSGLRASNRSAGASVGQVFRGRSCVVRVVG